MSRLDQAAQRSLQHLQEPGACFTALPLARLSYSLNKMEFRDSVLDMDGRSLTPLGFAAVAQKTASITFSTARMVGMLITGTTM